MGNASKRTLDLTQLSLRQHPKPYTCPFCKQTPSAIFELIGEGEIQIRDGEGRIVGFDWETRQPIVPPSDAIDVIPFRGGLNQEIPPIYRLPTKSMGNYTINIFGKPNQAIEADLLMTIPGFTLSMTEISLDAKEQLGINLGYAYESNHLELSFQSTQANAEVPKIFLSIDPDQTGADYVFELGGITLGAPKTILSLVLEVDKGILHVIDNDGNADAHRLEVLKIEPDGGETIFQPEAGTLSLSGRGAADIFFKDDQLAYSLNGGPSVPLRGGRTRH